jgi:hypothetical protein
MKSLIVNFQGDNGAEIVWGQSCDGLRGLAQKVCVNLLTRAGSDRFLPARGNDIERSMFSVGPFDFLSQQHILNFGALKTTRDVRAFENETAAPHERLLKTRLALVAVDGNVAEVAVDVTAADGSATQTAIRL